MIDWLPSRYPRWRQVRLVIVRPSGTPEPHSINEVVTSLFHALRSLGCTVDIQENEPIGDGTNIFFRAHLLPPSWVSEMPQGSIIYNFEQIFERSPWVGPVYRDLLSRVPVWDYSRRNLAAIGSIADPHHRHLVPLGHVPQLTRIPSAPVEDIDVLFYGVVNPRRRAILLELQQAGLRLRVETNIRGTARDALISRAKIVLNLHFYPTAIFEIVRVSYLLANRKAVVGECGPHTEIDSDIREAIAAASYDRLCETVLNLQRDDSRRLELARRGQEIFARRRLPDILAQAIAETEAAYSRRPAAVGGGARGRAAKSVVSKAEPEKRGGANTHRPKRILFYAINGNGLGHVVRLSVIARALKDQADIAFYSTCRFADQYWPGRIFAVHDRLDDRFELTPEQRNLLGFYLALNRFLPDVLVCDTHWPKAIIRDLHERGIRTILVLRNLATEEMEPAIRVATRDFSSVLFPHHPAELESIYSSAPDLLARMTMAPCACIGPIARTTSNGVSGRSVIFALGGGGEYWKRTQANSVDRFIGEYRSVATTLAENFGMESVFAAGPLLDRPDDSLSPFKVVRSHNLHEMFGPDTIVVTRGGYNTCWEAVAAGARLIIVGGERKAHGVEDTAARACFLAAEGLAGHVGVDASEILKACTDLIERPVMIRDHYLRRSINAGLSFACDEIMGSSGLISWPDSRLSLTSGTRV